MAGRLKRVWPNVAATLLTFHLCALQAEQPRTIPALREWTDAAGSYSFASTTRIVLDSTSSSDLSTTASVFAGDLLALTGFAVPVVVGDSPQASDILLALGATDPAIGEEGYLLTFADHVTIAARTDAGVFYGTQSLLQILRQGFEVPAGTARDWPDFPERGMMVDVGRKFFSLPFLERHIKELAYLKLNYLHLHLSDADADGGYGFRLESSTHPEIVSAQHYSKAAMAGLIALGRSRHVMIVPEIDVPSHATALLAPHPELQLPWNPDKLDLSNPASYALVEDLLNEFLPLFPAPFWHTGGDEYLAPADYTGFPRLLTYVRQRYGPAANAQDAYIGFVNWIDGIVKAHGKQLRAWNDLYGVTGAVQTPNSDIVLEMWWPFILPLDALNRGHTIMNSELFTLYYVLGNDLVTNDPANAVNLYERWAPNKQWVASYTSQGGISWIDLPASTPGIRGGKFHVWCDSPSAQTEDQVQAGIAPHLRGLAQNSWASPKLTPTFAAFGSIIDPIGHTPDWGPDFSLMPSARNATVVVGQTAAVSLRVAAIGGFSQQVALTCTPGASGAGMTCTVSPPAIEPATAASASAVAVSIGTTPPGRAHLPQFACLAAFLGGLPASGDCSHLPPPTPGTPVGTYGVTLHASAGSLSHDISLSVTVQLPPARVRPFPGPSPGRN